LSDKKNKKSTGCSLGLITIGVIILIVGLWYLNYYSLKDLKPDDRGTFGDMFGSINALFSGLAFAGIIFTILLQRKELEYQREELKETREEFKTQNETLKIQRFENTFFNLLNIHHQIVSDIDFTYYKKKERERANFAKVDEEKESVTITGRDVFRFRYNKIHAELKSKPQNYKQIYLKHYEDAQTDFGHYFRNLYRMIKLVDETDFFYDSKNISEDEIFNIKYKYISIIRAQISDYELLWLFYNCLSSNGVERFKPFIEKYSFFNNLPKGHIPSKEHIELYSNLAYDREER